MFDAIIEKLSNNDTYIEHCGGTNVFRIRKDEKQVEKDEIIKFIKAIDSKNKKITNKSRISQLKQMRKKLLNRCSSLEETFVGIVDKKTETLNKLLDIDGKLASGKISKNALITCERNKLIRKYRSLGGSYDWAKWNF